MSPPPRVAAAGSPPPVHGRKKIAGAINNKFCALPDPAATDIENLPKSTLEIYSNARFRVV
jgi:hypothetical protein